jgi:hypothetical protein
MTIQIAQLKFDYKAHPESHEAYMKLSGFLKIDFLKEVLRKPMDWDAKGITYEIVAEVDTDDLEVAFEKTNTIDRGWWENAGVTRMFKGQVRENMGGCRSTSVGDLAFKDGKTYVVANFGFEEVVL